MNTQMPNEDMDLLREYAARGSDRAFETLVQRHIHLVYSAAWRRTGEGSLAEEVTQTVFILLARKAGSLGRRTILPSWLHRAAVFAAADALKNHRRRARREQEAHMQSIAQEPEDETWRQIAPLLDEAIAGLGENDRHAIVLRFFENKSLREVGAALGASEDAAKMRVARAVDKLRRDFARRGVTSSGAAIAEAMTAHGVRMAPAALAKNVAMAVMTHTAAAPSVFSLKGACTFMASSTAKTGVVLAVMAGLAAALFSEHRALARVLEERDALRRQWAEAKAAAGSSSAEALREPGLKRAKAASLAPGIGAPGDVPLWVRLQQMDPKLRPEQVAGYLASNHRNAASLLGSFRTTRDESFLREAMQRFPNDPRVAFEAVMDPDLPAAEKQPWLDALKTSAPDNALGNYLAAMDDFHSGHADLALQELAQASGKGLDDYTPERMQDDIEAYLGAGLPLVDATGLGSSQLLLPQLAQLKELAGDAIATAKSSLQAGDAAGAEGALQAAAALGQEYAAGGAGEPEVSRLVGIAIEKMALSQMDPAAPYGDSGESVQDRLNQLQQEKEDDRTMNQQINQLLPNISDEDYVVYKNRWLMFGERNAEQWFLNKYGSP